MRAPGPRGYYSVVFEDPDCIRLEVNHIPGKGLRAKAQTPWGCPE